MTTLDPAVTRRGYVAAAAGVTCTALAGCAGVLGSDSSTKPSDHDHRFTVELDGDGVHEPVALSVRANDDELERTIEHGDELEGDAGDIDEDVTVDIDYDEDLDIEVEWSVGEITAVFDIEQDRWEKTVGDIGFTVADGELTIDATVELTLPDGSTELTASDRRPVDDRELKIELEIDVEDDGTEIEFDVGDDD